MRYILFLSFLLPAIVHGQVVNGYAEVTAIALNVLTIGTSDESAASFTTGKEVVIMQMQDDVIGSNTSNNSSFGNLSSIQRAGQYSVRRITSVTRVLGTLTLITLDAPPGVVLNLVGNGSVQAITFERFGGGGNYTTTSNMSALAWNGRIGGVLAIQVGGKLTLQHDLTANAVGFRGGVRDRFTYTSPCNTTDYVWSSVAAGTEYFATKGEGIYKLSSTALADGRGKILNGGGGANQINAGGGGGGNYTAGGSGVLGWSCAADAGGIGGIGLSAQISASRVFMGGGGGGGEGNDDVSTDGANGGGIIMIKAAQIETTGSCGGGRVISANGGSASNSGNDGAGGGGAGGSIVLQVPLYTVAAGCPLTIRSNGGDGGTVNSSTHGGGGGGGQGTVVFSIGVPSTNITTQTLNGTGGCNETPCITRAGSGAGSNHTGIIAGSVGPLPIELVSFDAIPVDQHVDLRWSTASELNNAFFNVQRSKDTQVWEDVAHVPGAITSFTRIDYSASDERPLAHTSYYRLGQTDVDGTVTWSDIIPVRFDGHGSLGLFPNPAKDLVLVMHDELNENSDLRVLDALGRSVTPQLVRDLGRAQLDVSQLVPGSYNVLLETSGERYAQRLVVSATGR